MAANLTEGPLILWGMADLEMYSDSTSELVSNHLLQAGWRWWCGRPELSRLHTAKSAEVEFDFVPR